MILDLSYFFGIILYLKVKLYISRTLWSSGPCLGINGVRFEGLDEVPVCSLIEDGSGMIDSRQETVPSIISPGHLSLGQDFQGILLSQEPVPHHPAGVHSREEAPGTARTLWPEWLQETVPHDHGEQRLALPNVDPGRHPGGVQVGEVEDADVRNSWRWTSRDTRPLRVGKLLGPPLGGELGRLDGVLHQLLLVNIRGMEDPSQEKGYDEKRLSHRTYFPLPFGPSSSGISSFRTPEASKLSFFAVMTK